jgi:predicted N-acetyltransferase YhbS
MPITPFPMSLAKANPKEWDVPSKSDKPMDFSGEYDKAGQTLPSLFETTFAASEGADEGALIGRLVRRLLAETPKQDMRVFTVLEGGVPVGGIFFTRIGYDADAPTVFLLAPVAIATDRQGEGLGTRLIEYGLQSLRDEGVDIAVTYGDPAFYGRVGFRPIAESDMPAPYRLQHPEGWLGQSLTETPLMSFRGPSHCVAAFRDPVYW